MKKFFGWCKRYLSIVTIIGILVFTYIVFFQENSMFRYIEYSRTIDSLRVEIKHANDTLEYYRDLNERLSTDPEIMERVVREQYNMVKDGEDVYVFANEK